MITLLIDLDGVLVKDKELNPFPSTVEFIDFLREKKIPFRVVSNNSTRSPNKLVDDLKSKGINLEYEEVITPVKVLPDYLNSINANSIFVIGTDMLIEFLKDIGFSIRNDHHVDAVVIGQDRKVDFHKIKTATSAVFLNNAKIVPVNLSRIVRDSDGLYFPGAGSFTEMLKNATNYKGDMPNLGKPSPKFIETSLKGLPKEKVFLISDDIYTDLMGASKMGIKTIFMTTGKYKADEVQKSGFQPDFIFDDLKDLKAKISEWLR